MYESEVKITQSWLILCDPMDYTVHGILQARILSGQPFPSPGNLPNPGIEPRFPALQADSLPADPPGKPKNTGVSSLSLLQRIFLIQELNPGLPHCSWILYQLSHKGSPKMYKHLQIPLILNQYMTGNWEPCLLSNGKGLFCFLQLLLVFWFIKMVSCQISSEVMTAFLPYSQPLFQTAFRRDHYLHLENFKK